MYQGILNDQQIADLCVNTDSDRPPMIAPYEAGQIRKVEATHIEPGPNEAVAMRKIISYGTSCYGYDSRLSEKDFRVFSNMTNQYIDPKRLCSNAFTKAELQHDEHTGEAYFWMPPLSYALGVSMEYFFMPDNVIAICLGKSTYARAGLLVNVTPLEAGWHGEVTLEFCNPTPMPMRVYANEGICQFLFLRGERPQTTYAERQGGAGKYQGQRGITLPRV